MVVSAREMNQDVTLILTCRDLESLGDNKSQNWHINPPQAMLPWMWGSILETLDVMYFFLLSSSEIMGRPQICRMDVLLFSPTASVDQF